MLLDARTVQRFMQARGVYAGAIDGDYGPASDRAGRALLASLGKASSYVSGWNATRTRFAVEQMLLKELGFYTGKVDGLTGPMTQVAVERWQDWVTFTRPPLPAKDVAYQKPVWPRQADMHSFYGKPGTGHVKLDPPYQLYYGGSRVSGFQIHEKCHDSALRVMDRVLDHYGEADIHKLGLDRFGGCFNNRTMRDSATVSTHAYACAIDWDPDRNQLRWTSRSAQLAKPAYAKFWELWEEEGWISLGRARNFDWMHVQAARL